MREGDRHKTFHPGKRSQYHETEGRLRRWIIRKRNKRIPLTKHMVIRKAQEWNAKLRDLEPHQLESWWTAFRAQRGITTRRIGSFAKGGEKLIHRLVDRYRKRASRATQVNSSGCRVTWDASD